MYHSENFTDIEYKEFTHFPCGFIIFMQFSATIATEIINFNLIYEAKDAKEALMNFIALQVIS